MNTTYQNTSSLPRSRSNTKKVRPEHPNTAYRPSSYSSVTSNRASLISFKDLPFNISANSSSLDCIRRLTENLINSLTSSESKPSSGLSSRYSRISSHHSFLKEGLSYCPMSMNLLTLFLRSVTEEHNISTFSYKSVKTLLNIRQ